MELVRLTNENLAFVLDDEQTLSFDLEDAETAFSLDQDDGLSFTLESAEALSFEFGYADAITLDLKTPSQIGVDNYEGDYVVTPMNETQTLNTNHLRMTQNVTINPIPSNYGLITWNGSNLRVS